MNLDKLDIKPINDAVAVRLDEAQHVTASGIHLAPGAMDDIAVATVTAVTSGWTSHGHWVDPLVAAGDRVLVNAAAVRGDGAVKLIRYTDILGKVQP